MFILISLGLTIILFGPENFKFTNINWITYKDTLIDQLAWKFFYNDNWHFPLGKNPNYGIEIGNSIDKLSLPRKFGIIFLDGDHRASTVYKEIPFALKCLDDGGVIILHDYFPNLEPLWKNQMPIAGPFLAIQRFINEGIGFNILPFGELPWSTKFGSHLTSLAILAKS